jgi:hypothetical protein
MNSAQFQEQIKTYSEQYRIWIAPIEQFKKSYTKEHNISYKEIDKLFQAIKDFADKQRTENDLPGKINSFLDQNYIVYLDSTLGACEKIRASFYENRDFENFLFEYTQRAVAQLQAIHDEVWLWRGLVSISLENCSIDVRDTLIGLAELFVAAEKQGIDPKAPFQRVAKLSSQDKPRGGSTPVYEMMMNFEDSAILQERRNRATSYSSF